MKKENQLCNFDKVLAVWQSIKGDTTILSLFLSFTTDLQSTFREADVL